jgi:hypothetical protein
MKKTHFRFCLLFGLSICFFSSCFSPPRHQFFPTSEQKRYEAFFKRFLFLEQAVYTLYGSKPMTEIVLCPESLEERLAAQKLALEKLTKKERKQLQKESFQFEEDYWFEETWTLWEEKLKTLPIKRYLFVERKVGIPSELQKNRYIYFVNIAETALVLQKHYSLFRKYVGFDFDPLSVVFDIKNEKSPFWNAIWGNEISDHSVCLHGILFGYGLENSYPFSFHFFKSKSSEECVFIESFLKSAKPTVSCQELKQFQPPSRFLLPAYASFSVIDFQKQKYQAEYDNIKKIYSRSDLIECTMQKLLN